MKKDPILNKDKVVVHTEDEKIFYWRMGDLKNAFLNKKLDYVVKFVYLPRTNKRYYVNYSPTKGFTYIPYEKFLKIMKENKR